MESTPSVNSNTDPRVHEEDHCDVRTWMLKALQDIDIGVDVSDESLQVCFLHVLQATSLCHQYLLRCVLSM
jgi:hypothetical protein